MRQGSNALNILLDALNCSELQIAWWRSMSTLSCVSRSKATMHDIGARGPQPAAEPRPAAARFLCLGRPRPGRNFFVVAAAGCGPFVPAFVAYDT